MGVSAMMTRKTQLLDNAPKVAAMCLLLGCLCPAISRAQVGPPPVILVQPLDQVVLSGDTAVFSVEASSTTTLHYQWQFNGTDLPGNGAKKSIFTIASAALSDVGKYSVRVSNNGGSVTSSSACLWLLPTSYDDTYTTPANTLLTIPPSGVLTNDVSGDGSPMNALLVTNVSHGSLSLNPDGGFTYLPDLGFIGSDSFNYSIRNTFGTGNVATVTINVQAGNQPPLAVDDFTNTFEDVSVTINVLANDTDPEGTPLTITSTSTTNGMVAVNSSDIVFTPAPNFNGIAFFSYTISDGTNSATANVTVTVAPMRDPVAAKDDTADTLEDTEVIINVLANDINPDGAPLTITGTSTKDGTALISGDSVIFTPASNFNGTVVFSYTVTDGANSSSANVTVNVSPVNDAPVANPDRFALVMNTPITIPAPGVLANDTDVENDTLSAVLEAAAAHGSVTLNPDGSFTYKPASDYVGTDAFTYRAGDGSGLSAMVTVSLVISENPTPLTLGAAGMTTNGFKLQITGPAPATYIIFASANLRDWTPISTNAAPTGTVEFTDTTAAGRPQRWYQAIVEAKASP